MQVPPHRGTSDSKIGVNRDTIADFIRGFDKIDLSTLNPNGALAVDQEFAFIGNAALAVNGGAQVHYDTSVAGETTVLFDAVGDDVADLDVKLVGTYSPLDTDFSLWAQPLGIDGADAGASLREFVKNV